MLISHDHVDHCRSMGILNRMFGLPIYATAKTFDAAKRFALGEIGDLRYFASGETVQFGKVTVETIRTPHDAEDGVVFVVDDGKHRLGIMTDLGHVFNGLGDVVASLDAVLLESNYDPTCSPTVPVPSGSRNGLPGRKDIFRTSRQPNY